MDIAAAVDIERLRDIMIELMERSAASVRRYGGTVEYTGDGIMANFGAPVALEDNAFRACSLRWPSRGIEPMRTEVARRDGIDLRRAGRTRFGSGDRR